MKQIKCLILLCLFTIYNASLSFAGEIDDIFTNGSELLSYDFVPEDLDDKKINKYKKAFYILRDSKSTKSNLVCKLYGQEYPCSTRRWNTWSKLPVSVSDILGPETSDLNSVFGIADETNFTLAHHTVFDGPLPPPVPYLAYSEKSLLGGKPKFEEDIEYTEGNYKLSFGRGNIYDFAYDVAKQSMRDIPFDGISEFTTFAPVDAVYHGKEIIKIFKELSQSDYADTKCIGLCPRIIQRVHATRLQFLYCLYHRNQYFSSISDYCTTIAFVEGDDSWLRTRQLYGITDGRGAGPEERFLCSTAFDQLTALESIKKFLENKGYKTVLAKKGSMLMASAVGLLSDVALNRYESVNILVDAGSGAEQKPPTKTLIGYVIPIYKLSATQMKPSINDNLLAPETFDQGKTPPDRIVRAFEADLRRGFESNLKKGKCTDKPTTEY